MIPPLAGGFGEGVYLALPGHGGSFGALGLGGFEEALAML